MLSLAKRLQTLPSHFRFAGNQLRYAQYYAASSRRRKPRPLPAVLQKPEKKSEWWIVDAEMHEIGDHVPPRERFAVPRVNFPNWRRKKLREQYMRRTRLTLKDTGQESWCKQYMELYEELRENWERLYWDEGYSKKIGYDRANYESAEDDDDDGDFNPYRSSKPSYSEQLKGQGFVRNMIGDGMQSQGFPRTRQGGGMQSQGFARIRQGDSMQSHGFARTRQGDGKHSQGFARTRQGDGKHSQGFARTRQGDGDTWGKVDQVRDKFEYDRERRLRQNALAPMNRGATSHTHHEPDSRNRPFDPQKYLGQSEEDSD